MASVSNRLCAWSEMVGSTAQIAARKNSRSEILPGLRDRETDATRIARFTVDWRSTGSSCIAVFTPDSKQRMCHRKNASARVVHLR
jgi:hypothetical protein